MPTATKPVDKPVDNPVDKCETIRLAALVRAVEMLLSGAQ